jgi:RimJ/RimL family protein N-acetyltransferase
MSDKLPQRSPPPAPIGARLVSPGPEHVPAYRAALQNGYWPSNLRGAASAREQLDHLQLDPQGFLAAKDDPQGLGPAVVLPDGSMAARLPGLVRWIWLDQPSSEGPALGFAGSIGLRWMAGHAPLPPHVLGHIGYSVVPWQRRQGLATWALGAVLPLARQQGMNRLEITTDPDNVASQRVIESHGGLLLGRYARGAAMGGGEILRYQIVLL